jgi:translation initiation factor 2 alpha subunit (eIF-2alpha)
MCQRLEHVTDINKNVWHEAFKNTLTENKSLFDAVHNEEMLASGQSGLPQELTDALIKNFTKLFGFTLTTIQKNVLIQCFRSDGNQYVKDVLLRINRDKEWTTEELNQDPERVNLSVKLIGLPKILLTVSSNLAQNAESAMQEAMSTLRQANFNILMEC